ncbi:unnamed protein product, partial [marine sediment metagenome]
MRKKKKFLLLISVLLFIVVFSSIQNDSSSNYQNQTENETPQLSEGLEGAENLLIVKMIRTTNLSSFGLANVKDRITILNQNNNPISSILIGILLKDSSNLVYFRATGQTGNTLLVERSNKIMLNYEMITVYFDSPLFPSQEVNLTIIQTFKNLLTYKLDSNNEQIINFTGMLFPILPYKSEGDIRISLLILSISNFVPNMSLNRIVVSLVPP